MTDQAIQAEIQRRLALKDIERLRTSAAHKRQEARVLLQQAVEMERGSRPDRGPVVSGWTYPVCECGHSAWSHGDQSGSPSPADECHAATPAQVLHGQVEVAGEGCACPRYRPAAGWPA